MLSTCMTLEQMVMAPTALSPPNREREELKEMFTRLSVDCMIKGETPMASTGSSTAGCIPRCRAWRRSRVRLPSRKVSTHTAETPWAMTVARAAPFTPMPKPKMNTGSSTMFTPAPTSTVAMEKVEKPWVVMKVLSPREICTKMVPHR